MNLPKVGRNDPCPCGSGKKYKNCHMKEEESKKTYTASGKRKFKAKVISLSEKSTDIFQRTPPAAAMPTNIEPGQGLKFRITSKNYQTTSSEPALSFPETTKGPLPQAPVETEFKPGDEFKPTSGDFREGSEKKE